MMRRTVVVAIGLIVWTSACALGSDAPSVDFLLAALSHQNTATVECTFTCQHFNTVLGGGKVGVQKSDRDHAVPLVRGDLTDPVPTRYVRTPEMLYRSKGDEQASSERANITTILDYRGKAVQKRVGEDTGRSVGSITLKTPARFWIAQDRIETVLYGMYPRKDDDSTRFLYGWVKYGVVSNTMEAINGHQCWKADIKDTGDCIVDHYEIWLDPEVGFNPQRVAMHGNDSYNGDWTVVVDSNDYREIDKGIWFPAKQTLVKNVPKKGILDHKIVFTATSLAGDKRYSKEDLKVKFDPDTLVTVLSENGDLLKVKAP